MGPFIVLLVFLCWCLFSFAVIGILGVISGLVCVGFCCLVSVAVSAS